MNNAEYVTSLYRSLLGREPDEAGFRSHLAALDSGAKHISLYETFVNCREHRVKMGWQEPSLSESDCRELIEMIGSRGMTIVDAGARLLEDEDHVYRPLLDRKDFPIRVVGFDPFLQGLRERAEKEADPRVELIEAALGDGQEWTFHGNSPVATSSMLPLNVRLTSQYEHLDVLRNMSKIALQTHRLDDYESQIGIADFIKLDIQGFEHEVLSNAKSILGKASVIHCEVEFDRIYQGQKLFSDVESLLRSLGWHFVDFSTLVRYRRSGAQENETADTLLWGDALFFRNASSSDPDFKRNCAVKALVSDLVYQKSSLARAYFSELKS